MMTCSSNLAILSSGDGALAGLDFWVLARACDVAASAGVGNCAVSVSNGRGVCARWILVDERVCLGFSIGRVLQSLPCPVSGAPGIVLSILGLCVSSMLRDLEA